MSWTKMRSTKDYIREITKKYLDFNQINNKAHKSIRNLFYMSSPKLDKTQREKINSERHTQIFFRVVSFFEEAKRKKRKIFTSKNSQRTKEEA